MFVQTLQKTGDIYRNNCDVKCEIFRKNFVKVLAKSKEIVYNIYCLMCDEAGGGRPLCYGESGNFRGVGPISNRAKANMSG